jgi:hypothetical protein
MLETIQNGCNRNFSRRWLMRPAFFARSIFPTHFVFLAYKSYCLKAPLVFLVSSKVQKVQSGEAVPAAPPPPSLPVLASLVKSCISTCIIKFYIFKTNQKPCEAFASASYKYTTTYLRLVFVRFYTITTAHIHFEPGTIIHGPRYLLLVFIVYIK